MDNVRIHVYYAGHIPASVRRALKTMGGTHPLDHLRRLVRDHEDDEISLVEAIVLFVDDKPIGWAAFYVDKVYNHHKHVGIWVRTRQRGKGYGRILTDLSFNRWSKEYPTTYNHIEEKWNAKYRGEDTTHIAWQGRAN